MEEKCSPFLSSIFWCTDPYKIYESFLEIHQTHIRSIPCDLRPLIQPAKYGLKLKVVLKWRDISTENI